MLLFFFRVKTQTRDANAPVETETRDAQRSRKQHVPRKEIFFVLFCFFVFFGLVVFLPPKNVCVCFVCFLFFETTREKSFFFSLVVDVCVVGLPHTEIFVSFLFFSFLFSPDEKQPKRDTKREYEMIRVW